MLNTRTSAFGLTLIAVSALAGCNSTPAASTAAMATVATSGTPAPSSSNFVDLFNTANLQPATATPMTGTANYTGQVEVRTSSDINDADNVVYGDLNMAVNFAGGANPVSATVSNLAGRLGGVDTTIAGTLTTTGASGANTVLALPVLGTTATSIAATAQGTLTDPTGTLSGAATMSLTGQVKGTGGASIVGSNGLAIAGTGSVGGGRLYANQ